MTLYKIELLHVIKCCESKIPNQFQKPPGTMACQQTQKPKQKPKLWRSPATLNKLHPMKYRVYLCCFLLPPVSCLKAVGLM